MTDDADPNPGLADPNPGQLVAAAVDRCLELARTWHAWESLGGSFNGQPAAAARDADRIDLFAISTDGVLRHRWWDGKRWVEWRDVAGAPHGGRAVTCVWSGGRLDVFLWGADGGLHYADLA